MERADRIGLGVAVVGHAALIAALSLGLLSTSRPLPPINDPMDVQLVDAIGLRSAAPAPTEAPAESQAPQQGPPEEAAPPQPEPEPAPPEPVPEPPKPAPPPQPKATPKPADKAPSKPAEKAPPKPAPKPAEKTPAKPAPAKPAPAKTPAKPAPARAAPAKPAPKATDAGSGEKPKAKGSRLGPDFLKGIVPEKSAGKSATPRAAEISDAVRSSFAAAVARQVQPCYDLGPLKGTTAMSIVTIMRLRYNPDGSVNGKPELLSQTGVGGGNQQYAARVAEVARSAVLRCSPIRLPAEIYKGGWEDFDMRFTPGQFG